MVLSSTYFLSYRLPNSGEGPTFDQLQYCSSAIITVSAGTMFVTFITDVCKFCIFLLRMLLTTVLRIVSGSIETGVPDTGSIKELNRER